MTLDYSDYARTYSAMADEELLELSQESALLLEIAQKALQSEFDRRGLKSQAAKPKEPESVEALYCSQCEREVTDPLTCGSCSASICRVCGAPLDVTWEVDNDSEVEGLEGRIKVRESVAA